MRETVLPMMLLMVVGWCAQFLTSFPIGGSTGSLEVVKTLARLSRQQRTLVFLTAIAALAVIPLVAR